MQFVLRRANVSRKGGTWRTKTTTCTMASATSGASIALTIGQTVLGSGGVSFHITGRKSYGRAGSLEEAEAEFRAEYEKWRRETGKPT